MKALRWHGRLDARVEDIEVPPPPAPGEAQIKVLSCGICGTDAEEVRNGPLFIPTDRPHPLTGKVAPVVMGHEVCGEVVGVGDGRAAHLVGQLVAVDGLFSCGTCWACLRHRVNLCQVLGSIGFSSDGGLASLLNAPARGCLPLASTVPPDHGALAEPLAVAVRALKRSRLTADERVCVVGAGTIGLLAAQASAAMGAKEVALVESDPQRRALAQAAGHRYVLEPNAAKGLKADVVVECSGSEAGVSTAFCAAGPAGRVVLVGITARFAALPVLQLVREEQEVLGSLSHVYDEDFQYAVTLLNTSQVSPTVPTTVVSLELAVQHLLGAAPLRAVKLLVHPDGR
jgi:(R,R)-butanediol dehydrogenase/meso-butanediol dehydrogenase/diacetyl reductase